MKRTRRTLKGEVSNAIEQYLDREERLEPPATENKGQDEPKRKRGK